MLFISLKIGFRNEVVKFTDDKWMNVESSLLSKMNQARERQNDCPQLSNENNKKIKHGLRLIPKDSRNKGRKDWSTVGSLLLVRVGWAW